MTKVIQYTNTIQDNGAETLIKDYALNMRNINKNIEIIVLVNFKCKSSANQRILDDNGVKTISVYQNWNLFTKVFNRLFGKKYIPYKLKKILRIEKPDVIHIHLAVLSYLYPIREDIKGIRLIYTCHSIPERYFAGANKKEFICAQYFLNNNNLQLIALHNEMKRALDKMFNIENTVVIRNGINYKRFLPESYSKEDQRKRLGISVDAFVICHIGRFSYIKNHSFIVDVFEKVYERDNRAYLLLVGDGELKQEIIDKLKEKNLYEKCKILSHRSDIPEILSCADVFLFPSLFEGIPITLLEAQRMGLKCVCSNTINKEAIFSEEVIQLPLECDINVWTQSIMQSDLVGVQYVDASEYDIDRVLNKLDMLYEENGNNV